MSAQPLQSDEHVRFGKLVVFKLPLWPVATAPGSDVVTAACPLLFVQSPSGVQIS